MKTTRTFRLAILGAVAAAVLAPYGADSGTCGDPAARDLLAASYATTMLNGPKGEDTNFFTKAGGVPNIMVLLDTTGSMSFTPDPAVGESLFWVVVGNNSVWEGSYGAGSDGVERPPNTANAGACYRPRNLAPVCQ